MTSEATPVRVLCGAFEDLVAIGLRHVLVGEPSVELIGEGLSLDEIEAEIEAIEPDVVIVNFGSLGTPSRLERIRGARPESQIVVLANRPSRAEGSRLLAHGATACISKETQARDIVNAIHLASRGMHLLPRAAMAPSPGAPDGTDQLTAREAEVLDLLRRGSSNAEIAHLLSIGVETVRTHARNVYRKLGINSRRDLPPPERPDPGNREPVVVEPPGAAGPVTP